MIVRIAAGLGNQLFSWAFGRSVAAARNEELFFEKHDLDAGHPRAYSLGAFDIDLQFKKPNGETQFIETHEKFGFDPDVYKVPNGTHFIGNWQTEKYFDELAVRTELILRGPVSEQTLLTYREILAEQDSAFIHVRRTDYLIPSTDAYHGNVTMEYYSAAMALIRELYPSVRFFIFSDDPQWCTENFKGYTVVEHNAPGSGATGPGCEHEDLFLMNQCDHAIIPNSSFGWWGAYLSPLEGIRRERIVIAPKVWFRKEGLRSADIVPSRWITL